MKDEKQILEQSIEDHQQAIDKAKKELAAMEVTYSVGDRFKNDRPEKAILVHVGNGMVTMVGLGDGQYHCAPKEVKDADRITVKELKSLCNHRPVRYWDNRKKVHV